MNAKDENTIINIIHKCTSETDIKIVQDFLYIKKKNLKKKKMIIHHKNTL